MEQPEPIMQEKAVVQGVSGPALVRYVLPESDLSMDASGTETLNNIRDLFETAIQPEDREQLAALFRLATELAEVPESAGPDRANTGRERPVGEPYRLTLERHSRSSTERLCRFSSGGMVTS